jgi:hypothetical protein
MKYSLRSLMIVVTLICVGCFLLPQTYRTPWGTLWSWNREQRTVLFIVGVAIATVCVRALARSSSYDKP